MPGPEAFTPATRPSMGSANALACGSASGAVTCDRGWGGCGVGHFVLAPLNWFWRKDPASLKPFGQKGNSGGFCDTFPVIVFGQKLSPAGFVLFGGSTGGFLAMVRLL